MPVGAFAQDSEPSLIRDDDSKDPLEVHGNEILVLAPRILGQIEVPQQPVQVFAEEDIVSYGANSIADLIEAISPQTTSGRGRGDGQLGRASWRGSGCQYVEISVVGAALKKKKNEKQ